MQEGQLTTEQYENKLKEKDQELHSLKAKIEVLENEVSQSQKAKTQRSKEHEEVAVLKEQSEGILTKAKAMIFENTKVIKNQELQIEALGQQNESLKDVVQITKDLLEIRSLEVKQLENKIGAMEGKVKAEKQRQDLLHQKLENMIRHNGELKREYEAQLCLFSALRERYNERELAKDVVDNLKEDVKNEKAAIQANLNAKSENHEEKALEENKPEEGQKETPKINQNAENENKEEKAIEENKPKEVEKEKAETNTNIETGNKEENKPESG